MLVGGQLRGPPRDAAHPVVLEEPLQGVLVGGRLPLPVGELLEQFLLGALQGARECLGVLGGEEAGVHPEEALNGVAVLHGGAAVAVDERARLLPRHPRAVGDLLLGVLAAVRLQPGAAQQVQTLHEPGLHIGLARGPAAEQGPHDGLGDAGGDGEPADVEDLGVRHPEAVREGPHPGDDGGQRGGRHGARTLEATRHRQLPYVSHRPHRLLTSSCRELPGE